MKQTKVSKVSQEGLLGAVSQAKMIYTSLRDGGIEVLEVNDEGMSEGDSLSSLNDTMKPLILVAQEALESFRMTHWKLFKRWFKRWITRCKDNPRWKNPYTYAYIFIGLVFMLSVYSNIDLRIKNSRLLHENQTHRMVDVLMEVYPVYRKERTMVQEFIDNQGLSYTWDRVLEMRARIDSLEVAKAKQK